jgi:ubiquinone/menaquinone biosynthesis C-methylase UbiE
MNIEEQRNLWNNPNNWVDDGNEWSIYFGSTNNLWNIIYQQISKYLKNDVLEIAPGFGRMTEYLLKENINLSIIDLNNICIEKCQEKFGSKVKEYIINDGKTLNFNNNSFNFIFSYDSFVHMTDDVIESYIKEIYRALKNDGYAFIHHSFFYGSNNPTENIAGRSNMTPEVFSNLVKKYYMEVISQENFKTSEYITDIITIFHKK